MPTIKETQAALNEANKLAETISQYESILKRHPPEVMFADGYGNNVIKIYPRQTVRSGLKVLLQVELEELRNERLAILQRVGVTDDPKEG